MDYVGNVEFEFDELVECERLPSTFPLPSASLCGRKKVSRWEQCRALGAPPMTHVLTARVRPWLERNQQGAGGSIRETSGTRVKFFWYSISLEPRKQMRANSSTNDGVFTKKEKDQRDGEKTRVRGRKKISHTLGFAPDPTEVLPENAPGWWTKF